MLTWRYIGRNQAPCRHLFNRVCPNSIEARLLHYYTEAHNSLRRVATFFFFFKLDFKECNTSRTTSSIVMHLKWLKKLRQQNETNVRELPSVIWPTLCFLAKITDSITVILYNLNQSINQSVLMRINYIHTSHRRNQLSRTGAHTIHFSSAATRET